MFAFILAAALLGQCDLEPLPVVEEEVEEIALVYRPSEPAFWPLVVFIRDGRQLDSRGHCDTMHLIVDGDRFGLVWRDWCQCERVVWTKRLGVYEIEPLEFNEGEWWNQARPMVQLRTPPP